MYRSPLLNKAIIPFLALGSLVYAVYATGVMRPRMVTQPPLSAPPERPFESAVAAVGVVEPASELIAMAPRVPGWIQTVHVVTGQSVRAGDPLFTLDSTDLSAELALRNQAVHLAQAQLTRLKSSPRPEDVPIASAVVQEAKANLEDARAKLQRVDSMTDQRAVSDEERTQRRQAVAREEAQVATRQAELNKLLAGAWQEDLLVAESELSVAKLAAARTQADIDRMTTHAPIDAIILRLTARSGQYADTGMEEPLVTIGSPGPLHIRADFNEHDVPRVFSGASAVAMVRGDASNKIDLTFVRFEPQVTPKKALSGLAQERVDTRVMQVIYKVASADAQLLVGQQVDLYIETDSEDKTTRFSNE